MRSEAGDAEQRRRDRRRWRRRAPARCVRDSPARAIDLSRRRQHLRGDVDAEEARVGIARAAAIRLRAGAAADLEHACRRPAASSSSDQPVAAEQVIFARERRRCGAAGDRCGPSARGTVAGSLMRSALEDVEMEAAIDRRAVAGGEARDCVVFVAPAVEQIAASSRPGSSVGSAAVRKITRAPGRAVRVISRHSALSWASVIQSCASSST